MHELARTLCGAAAALMVGAACDHGWAAASVLAVCPAGLPVDAAFRLRLNTTDQPPADLLVARAPEDIPPGCRSQPLPFAADAVRWLGALPGHAAAGDRFAVTAREKTGEILGIEEEKPASPALSRPVPPRQPGQGTALPKPPSAWAWDSRGWRDTPQALIAAAGRAGIGALYISVPVLDGDAEHAEKLAAFIAQASQARIEIYAVEGDPAMITDEGLAFAVTRGTALARYSAAHPQARLAGVQYDIEPYLLPSFGVAAASAWMRWSLALRTLSQALGEPVDAVIPYWIGESPGGGEAVAAARPALRCLTIMAYRTEPNLILDAASPALGMAERLGLPAVIGLEAGPVAKESRTSFRPAEKGELHLAALGDVAAALLLDAPQTGGGTRAFRRSHSVPSDPSRVSFAGRTARLFDVAGELSGALTAYPAAQRIAFHGLTELETATAGNSQNPEDNANGPKLENPAH
jgi:hypothetical protein